MYVCNIYIYVCNIYIYFYSIFNMILINIYIPFNPFQKSWYTTQKSKLSSSPLDISKDIWVEDEFWNFCSGEESTFEQLKSLFFELGQENFAAEFHDIFYQN